MGTSPSDRRMLEPTLQLHVNLKSNGGAWFTWRDAGAAHDRRGLAAERSRRLCAALLRAARTDRLGAVGVGPPPLSAGGAAANRLHRLRAANRADPGRDRAGTGQAASGSRAHPPRLVAPVARLDVAHRRADPRAGTPPGRADSVHRLRVPVARPLPAGEPR